MYNKHREAALGTMRFPVFMCVCVWERERERERESTPGLSLLLSVMHTADKVKQRAGQISEQQTNESYFYFELFKPNTETFIQQLQIQ